MIDRFQNIAFAEFELDRDRRRLLRNGEPVVLYAKTFDLLDFLVRRSGQVLTKDEILEGVWPGQFVEEANLSVQISTLRKALGDRTNDPRFLVTVPGVGYKFVADIRDTDAEVVIERRTVEHVVLADDPDSTSNEPLKLSGVRRGPLRLALIGFVAVVLLGLGGYSYFRTPAKTLPIRTIAVLPFKPLAAENRNEPLEIGIADSLITKLSNFSEISVRPISAVRKYSGLEQDAVAAGREQQVDAVLDGHILQSGDTIRMTVRFVRVADGSLIWTNQFDEKLSDIFRVQDSISQRVVDTLALKLTGDERNRLARRHTENPEAYQQYMLGRFHFAKRTRPSVAKAVEYFQRAIEKDPNYALAYSDLGAAYSVSGWYDFLPPHEAYPKAKEAIATALSLDDTIADAHTVSASIKRGYDWDIPGAEIEHKRSIELEPNSATAHHWYGVTLGFAGRYDEGIALLKRAQELDPLSSIITIARGDLFLFARRFDDASEQYKKVLELEPNYAAAHRQLGVCYFYKGLNDEAVDEWLKAATLAGRSPEDVEKLSSGYKRSGVKGFFNEAAALLLRSQTSYISPYDVAAFYSAAGEKEKALSWLERAFNEHSSGMMAMDSTLLFDNIRNEPRFLELRRKVGLKQ